MSGKVVWVELRGRMNSDKGNWEGREKTHFTFQLKRQTTKKSSCS